MQSVGEIATLFPVHGGFVEVYEISANVNLSRFEYPANLLYIAL